MSDTLKFPAGEWTHQDFADANGKTKPSVYNQLQAALKNGTVVKGGMKTGKGKPSQLYKVTGAVPVTVTKVDEFQHGEKTVEVFDVKPVEEKIDRTVVSEVTQPVVVVDVTTDEKIDEKIEQVVAAKAAVVNPELTQSKFLCPVCKQPLSTYTTATGVMVKCFQPIEVCSSTENPFGHSNNEKNAYEILVSKWNFASKGRE